MPQSSNNRLGATSTVRYTSVMAESAIPHRPISVREYLDMEEVATIRHEYVSGTIHAQAGTTKRHNRIALNIATRLASSARGGPCRVYASDVKLRVSDDIFYYPDVMVAREPEGQDPIYEDAPCLVVEVVSPSTATIDRREKLNAYRKVSTLKSYLIVDQENKQIERHWRDDDGLWWEAALVGTGEIPIPCPETRLSLEEIYEGL